MVYRRGLTAPGGARRLQPFMRAPGLRPACFQPTGSLLAQCTGGLLSKPSDLIPRAYSLGERSACSPYGTYIQSPTGMRTTFAPEAAMARMSSSRTHVRQCLRSCLFPSTGPSAWQKENWSIPVCCGVSLPNFWSSERN
eukprot:scaffold182561_cov36-Tisochrysis_lutea.AAC.1